MRNRAVLSVIAAQLILWALVPASHAGVCALPTTVAPVPPGTIGNLTAEQVSIENHITTAIGKVRVERAGAAVEAPRLQFNKLTQEVIAKYGLRYIRDGLALSAGSARVDVDDQTGRFTDTHYLLTRQGGRGSAGLIRSLGGGEFLLRDADYTTCALPDPAWQIEADRIVLDRNSGRGEVFDSILRVAGVPVLYSPYWNFPLDDARHTGFLIPTLGHSSDSGFEFAAPYYLNLAPDLDATLTPRLLTKRGLQLGAQLRYLNTQGAGRVAGEYLPSDKVYGKDRYLFHFQHRARFTRHLGIQADYTQVSDDDYFDDLSTVVAETSSSQLEQMVRVTAANPWARFSTLVQDYQTLDEDDFKRREPYARLPQFRLSLLSPTGALRAGLYAEAVRFESDEEIDARRYDLRPRLQWSLQRPGWFITSEVAYRYTRYDLHNSSGADQRDRSIPSYSLDFGLRLQRSLDNGWIQTLEPRVYYLYNGYEDQSALPLFDTGIPNLHYGRLFAHNRFVGADRVGDANQVTLGVTSRFIDPISGRTVLEIALGRVFGFTELRVRLPQRSTTHFGTRNSDMVTRATYRPAANWFAGTSVAFEPGEEVNRAGLRAGYSDQAGRRLEIGYRFFRDALDEPGRAIEDVEQTHILVSWPLADEWHAVGLWNYSPQAQRSIETLAGFEYRPSCCWAVRLAGSRFVRDAGQSDTAVLLQFELTGLGRFGDDIDALLERDIVDASADYYDLLFR
ncbi:MAG: LPS-assembly protein LptD [Salinisphaera sp.]|nr:LPS-assembly protein LptD [Salinisphaera sp.]